MQYFFFFLHLDQKILMTVIFYNFMPLNCDIHFFQQVRVIYILFYLQMRS